MGTIEINTIVAFIIYLLLFITIGLLINSKIRERNLKRACATLHDQVEREQARGKENADRLWAEINSNYKKIRPLYRKIKSLQNRLLTRSKEIERLKHIKTLDSQARIINLTEINDLLKKLSSAQERIADLENLTETHITVKDSEKLSNLPITI